MAVFLTLLQKLLPLYFLVGTGYLVARFTKIHRETVAGVLIHTIVPFVIFTSLTDGEMTWSKFALPFVITLICYVISGSFYLIGKWVWPKSPIKNLLAFSAGAGNTGYFGLPVAIMLWGPSIASVAVLCYVGFIFYESTLGFYFIARGKHSARDAFIRVFKLPQLYAFIFGCIAATFHFKLTGTWAELIPQFRGAYSILGMMIIGMGVSGLKKFDIDLKFTGLAFLAKFLVWPIVALAWVTFDRNIMHVFDERVHQVILLISCVPMAANTVAFSILFDLEPEKAATGVLLSTLFALVFIPLMIAGFGL